MHVIFRESHGLEETATAVDLGQDPADLVMLSFSDSDVAALHQLATQRGIALAVLPADGRDDTRLDELSTLPLSTLRRLKALCDAGGATAAQAAIAQLALASGLYAGPVFGETEIPEMGFYDPALGVLASLPHSDRPRALVAFYRSYLTAADTAPIDALITALHRKGFDARGVFATSLKAPGVAAWLKTHLTQQPPAVIVNATAFSA